MHGEIDSVFDYRTECFQEEEEVDFFIPYSVFEREEQQKGTHDPAPILANWQRELLKPEAFTKEARGQTLLGRFEGVRSTRGKRKAERSILRTSKKCKHLEDVEAATEESQRMLEVLL